MGITPLSHTWVRYPGFSGHGVKCPILTTVVPGFSGDLIGCTIRSKWGSFGDLYLARKNRLCVWNKLFLAEIKFSQRRTRPVKSLWWQIVHMQKSTNEWKKSNNFLNNGTCWNTMVKPQTVRYRLIKYASKFWKYSRIWKMSLDSILNCFTRYKCTVIQKDFWINIHEWFGCNFPTWNIRNVWRARDDGHHYDVTSKCCGVTITTRLVEWTLSFSEINVFFCCFRELSGFKKYKWLPK